MSTSVASNEVNEVNEKTIDAIFNDANELAGLFEQEDDEGNIEYKQHLIEPTEERFERLISQMRYRLTEGGGEALYELGVTDSGEPLGLNDIEMEKSMDTMKELATENNAEASVVYVKKGKLPDHSVVEVLVRSNPLENEAVEVSVCILGNVDSGKSTITSTLSRGKLDNGNGLARTACFRFKHEIDTGRTSANSVDNFLSFNQAGEVVNYDSKGNLRERSDILTQSCRRVSFYDSPGHEAYLKTALLNVTGSRPTYNMIVVGANAGIQRMTREHLAITLSLQIPFFVVVTKIDLAPPNILEETIDKIQKTISKYRKKTYMINDEEGVFNCSKQMGRGTELVPVFQVSNVTGVGLDLLKLFLNLIPSDKEWIKKRDEPVEFQIDGVFQVPGTGIVVSGIMNKGSISTTGREKPVMWLGPFSDGSFRKIRIKCIHLKCVEVSAVHAGTMASFAISLIEGKDRKLTKKSLRRGMVILDLSIEPKAAKMFAAEVQILHHPGTIKINYQPIATLGTTYQAVKIHSMNTEVLRSGDRARVRFKFVHRPEYISPGMYIVFRENKCKGFGIIRRVIHDETNLPKMNKKREITKKNRKRDAIKKQTKLKTEAIRKVREHNIQKKKEYLKNKATENKNYGGDRMC